MIEIFTSNLFILMSVSWASFTIYLTWYFTRAKHYSPITPIEARQLWTIHKRNVGCNSKKWRQIKNRGKTVGFQCECGHKHIQRRPIVARVPAASFKVSEFDRLPTSHKSS